MENGSRRLYGVYPALVREVQDPDGQGRVKVGVPSLGDPSGEGRYEAWARVATFMAGPERGSWFPPDVDDEVLVCFEAGDPQRPYVVGGLWNGVDAPPEAMDGLGLNYRKVLRSRMGIEIVLDDTDGREALILSTPGGCRLELRDGPPSAVVSDGHGNSVRLDASGISITAAGEVRVSATHLKVSGSLEGSSATFDGRVTAESYTRG
jgi:uncharacterized protein involved in type VI secretion and phage assembly